MVCVRERDKRDGSGGGRERHLEREREWLSPEFLMEHWNDRFFPFSTGRLEAEEWGDLSSRILFKYDITLKQG